MSSWTGDMSSWTRDMNSRTGDMSSHIATLEADSSRHTDYSYTDRSHSSVAFLGEESTDCSSNSKSMNS